MAVAYGGLSAVHDADATLDAFFQDEEGKTQLRLIFCGSVDDGKSTLLGRILFDSQMLFEDQIAKLRRESETSGARAEADFDLALVTDGLAAEREQGITIDLAYRFFATEKRKFILADAPGHEQYTRNMATGASTADCAVLLIDARKGVLPQTRRHSFILSLMGVRQIVLAVNKMDLIDWDEARFRAISAEYEAFAEGLGFAAIAAFPISALKGDNVSRASEATPWFAGSTLLAHLETLTPEGEAAGGGFRLPVQWVNRPHLDFRGFTGTLLGGAARVGDPVVVLPSGREAKIARILGLDGDQDAAAPGEAATLTLDREVDVSRGDMLAAQEAPPAIADQFQAHIVWMNDQPLLPGRRYRLRIGTVLVGAQITAIKHKLDMADLSKAPATHLDLNDIAVCNLALDRPVAFAPYAESRALGGFILIDRLSNATVGGGMVDFALRRATNIHAHAMKVDKAARSAAAGHRPCALWFTGLSGSGKSTIADLVEQRLHALGLRTMTLDGDNLRGGLNRDLGFTDEDRVENIRRVAEVAKLMVDAGLITLVSFISPFRSERRLARELLQPGEFFEIFVDAPLEVCEARDPKGLYAKARAGQIPNFTGIGSAYEPPEAPELRLESGEQLADVLAERVVTALRASAII